MFVLSPERAGYKLLQSLELKNNDAIGNRGVEQSYKSTSEPRQAGTMIIRITNACQQNCI